MPKCSVCKEEVEEVLTFKVKGKAKKVCDECADEFRENEDIAEAGEAAMRSMMEYKGKW